MVIAQIIILSLSALLLTFVGIGRLSNPVKTYAKSSGINLPKDKDLMNEMRGIAAVTLTAGLMITLGIFISEFRLTSIVIGILIFLGFAIGRIISSSADGKPNKMIAQGLIFELVLGSANLVAFLLVF
jgi:hypothetical protein